MSISGATGDLRVLVTDEKNQAIYAGELPVKLELEKSDGSFWGNKDYLIAIKSRDDFVAQRLTTQLDELYYHNIFNLYGFVIDPFFGSMFNLTPQKSQLTIDDKTIDIQVEPQQEHCGVGLGMQYGSAGLKCTTLHNLYNLNMALSPFLGINLGAEVRLGENSDFSLAVNRGAFFFLEWRVINLNYHFAGYNQRGYVLGLELARVKDIFGIDYIDTTWKNAALISFGYKF